jgi:large subunit ribosomal protein L10Ae
MSKIPVDKMKQSITLALSTEKRKKTREFVETFDLQIGLKDYDTNKDK